MKNFKRQELIAFCEEKNLKIFFFQPMYTTEEYAGECKVYSTWRTQKKSVTKRKRVPYIKGPVPTPTPIPLLSGTCTVLYGLAQHSTAQHSIAQHCSGSPNNKEKKKEATPYTVKHMTYVFIYKTCDYNVHQYKSTSCIGLEGEGEEAEKQRSAGIRNNGIIRDRRGGGKVA